MTFKIKFRTTSKMIALDLHPTTTIAGLAGEGGGIHICQRVDYSTRTTRNKTFDNSVSLTFFGRFLEVVGDGRLI